MSEELEEINLEVISFEYVMGEPLKVPEDIFKPDESLEEQPPLAFTEQGLVLQIQKLQERFDEGQTVKLFYMREARNTD